MCISLKPFRLSETVFLFTNHQESFVLVFQKPLFALGGIIEKL